MSGDICLSADEMTTMSKYNGIFSSIPGSGVFATINGKSWFTSSLGTSTYHIPVPATAQKRVGIRIYIEAAQTTTLVEFRHPDNAESGSINISAAGALVLDPGNGANQESSSGLIQVNTEHYLEIDWTVSDTATILLYLDGVLVFTSASADTKISTQTTIDSVRPTTNLDVNWRDFYCLSVDGVAPQTFFGPARVVTLRPNGDGDFHEWLHDDGSAGDANNYTEVDDADPDEDTTYVKSATATDKDTYNFEDLPGSTGTVGFADHFIRSRKDDTATRIIHSVSREPGGTEDGSGDMGQATTYGWFHFAYDDVPGGTGWTRTQINNNEWGQILDT